MGIAVLLLAAVAAAETDAAVFKEATDGSLALSFESLDASALNEAGYQLVDRGFCSEGKALAASGAERKGAWRQLKLDTLVPEALGQAEVWISRSKDAKVETRLDFLDANGAVFSVESSTPSLYGSCGEWECLSLDVPVTPARPARLAGVGVRSSSDDPFKIGRVALLGGASSKAGASRVWKIHDVDWRKPSSLVFTSSYYEYGYERAPLIDAMRLLAAKSWFLPEDLSRSPGPERLLNDSSVLKLELRRRDGCLLWRAEAGLTSGRYLRLPEPKEEQSYFLTVKAFSAAGVLLGVSDFAYQVEVNAKGTGTSVWPPLAEALGLRVDGLEAKAPFALSPSQEPSLLLRGVKGASKVKISLSDSKGGSFLRRELSLVDGASTVIPLKELQLSRGRAYTVEAVFADSEGATVDYARLLFGFTFQSSGAVVPKVVPTYEDFFAGAGRTGLTTEGVCVTYDRLLLARLPSTDLPMLERQIASTGAAMILLVPWGEIEPIEGVYQFDFVDESLAELKSKGLKTLIGMGAAGDSLPSWLWYDSIMTRGQASIGPTYRYFSPYSVRTRRAMIEAWRAIIDRYGADPDVIGWAVMAGGSEGLLRDLPPDQICDYSPAGRRFFS